MPLLIVLAAAVLAGLWWFLFRRRRRRPKAEPVLAGPPPFGRGPAPLTPALAIPHKPDKGAAKAAQKADKAAEKSRRGRAPKVDPVAPSPAPFVPAPALAIATSADAIPPAPSAALTEPFGEALMPRWRRPSLKTARYASPRIAAAPVPNLTFAAGATSGLERRFVRYDLVALTDIPDEIRGAQVGQLQANDEVEITGRQGAWVKVRTPVGAEGWIHRTTLRAADEGATSVAPVSAPVVEESASPPPMPNSIEAEVAMGAFAAAARARAIELAQTAAAVSDPEPDVKPPKRARTRRPASPKAPKA